MAATNKKWIVRDGIGHIYGPFEVDRIRELLGQGFFTGEEQAAEYPAGDWQNMSSFAELYDIVLDSIAQRTRVAKGQAPKKEEKKKENTPSPLNTTKSKASIKTRTLGPDEFTKSKKAESQKIEMSKPEAPKEDFQTNTPPPLTNPKAEHTQRIRSKDIELTETRNLKRKKGNFFPLLLLIAAAGMFYLAYNREKFFPQKIQPVSLLFPVIKSKGDPAKAQQFIQQGWNAYYRDTFVGYIKAEEMFLLAVQEAPTNPDGIVMLLLTDLELWPYAKQDGADHNVLQNLLQLLSKADLYGPKRPIGAAVVDMLLGRDASARSQIDSSIERDPTDGRLYALSAQMYYDAGQFQQARAYYDKALRLMNYWAKPQYMLGLIANRDGRTQEAQQYFINALKINPSHSAARIELGVLEYRAFSHIDTARDFITVVLNSKDRVPPTTESKGRYVLAQILDHDGHRPEAIDQLKLARDLSPNDPSIAEMYSRLSGKSLGDVAPGGEVARGSGTDRQHFAMGEQYMRMNNYLAAQAQYKAAFEANPRNAQAATRAAEALWKLHQTSEALELLQKAHGADPRFTGSFILAADYLSQRFDFDGATKALESAMKANSKNYEVFRGYAQLFWRRGDANSAETYATRALQLYEADVKGNELMAQIQMRKKNIVKAMQFAKRAVELDATNVDAQNNYAKVLATYDGARRAGDYLRELIAQFPSQLAYRVALGEILAQDEQYDGAKQVLQQVIAADENNKDASLALGDVYFMTDKLDAALSQYFNAARVDPADPAPLFRAGELYIKANKPSDAQKQFQLVLRVNPLFPRAHYNLARAQYLLGIGDLAIKELEEEKKLNPRLADPYEFAGDIMMAGRKFGNATKEYQKAAELKPPGAGIYVKLAKAYRGQGSLDTALAMLRIATAKESGFAEIYRELGQVYEAKGSNEEAASAYQQYLRLEPNPPDKDTIHNKINQLQ